MTIMERENLRLGRYVLADNISRWADPEEIKGAASTTCVDIESGIAPSGGIPIISDGRTAWVDGSDTHTLVMGSTGSKKTRLFGMPLINILAMAGESFIATDPKGELYKRTSGLAAAKGYKVHVLNFRDLRLSDCWNPLALPHELYRKGKIDESISMINDFIAAVAEPIRRNNRDPYWGIMASSQSLAAMLFFIATASLQEASILNFANLLAAMSDPEITEKLARCVAEESIASTNFKSLLTIKGTLNTYGCVTSTATSFFTPFVVRPTLCQVLSKNSFDIRALGSSRHAVYIIVPDEKTTLHFLASAFIKQVYETLIDEAHQNEGGKLPVRVNFVLDEFCNIPKIPDMPSMISAARSRNMRFFLMIQSIWQLRQKYGDDAQTIKGNCDNWVFLTTRELDLLVEISDLCGVRNYKAADGATMERQFISISELQRFRKEYGEALILHGRNYPFVTELPDIDEYSFGDYPPVEARKRKLPEIERYNSGKVIAAITKKERPLLFSREVFGEDRYFEGPVESGGEGKKKDIFDW
jgi:type IV secretion system protein VirD4